MGNLIYKFANGKIGLMVIAFLLTSIFGSSINYLYQRTTWEREQQIEFLKRSLDKHEKLVNDLSELISGRAFHMERVIWAIENHIDEQRPITIKERKIIEDLWNRYYRTVIDWNENFRVHFSRLRYVTGKDMAKLFYKGELESKEKNTTSVYGYFRSAHKATLSLYRYSQDPNRKNAKDLLETARSRKDELYEMIDRFLLSMHDSLDKRILEMRVLQ